MKTPKKQKGEVHETYSFFVDMFPKHKRRLLSKEEEINLSQQIRKTRARLWYKLFGYAPMTEGMADYVSARIDNIDFNELLSASRAYRDNNKKKSRTDWEMARFNVAIELEKLDEDTELALEILQKIEDGETFGANFPAKSRPYGDYKKECRIVAMRHESHRHEFQKANVFLALTVARKLHQELVPFADLVQQALMGLMKAVNRFDASKGFRFSTYATHWIRHYVSRYVNNHARQVRLPVHTIKKITLIKKAKSKLSLESKEINVTNVAKLTGLSKKDVQEYLNFNQYIESIDDFNSSLEDANVYDQNTPEALIDPESLADESIVEQETKNNLLRAVEKLPGKLRHILECRYGLNGKEPLKLRELGEEMGVSRERVRQLQVQAEYELKEILRI